MMENDCHSMIIAWSYYEKHVGDYDHSIIEHVRKFSKSRLSTSSYYWISARINESFYQCSLLKRCFCCFMGYRNGPGSIKDAFHIMVLSFS